MGLGMGSSPIFFFKSLFLLFGTRTEGRGENCPTLQTVAGFLQKGLAGNSCSSYREIPEQLGPSLFSAGSWEGRLEVSLGLKRARYSVSSVPSRESPPWQAEKVPRARQDLLQKSGHTLGPQLCPSEPKEHLALSAHFSKYLLGQTLCRTVLLSRGSLGLVRWMDELLL